MLDACLCRVVCKIGFKKRQLALHDSRWMIEDTSAISNQQSQCETGPSWIHSIDGFLKLAEGCRLGVCRPWEALGAVGSHDDVECDGVLAPTQVLDLHQQLLHLRFQLERVWRACGCVFLKTECLVSARLGIFIFIKLHPSGSSGSSQIKRGSTREGRNIPFGRSTMMYVLSSGVSGKSLERHVLGLPSFVLSSTPSSL
jgi:hypothetical protein